MTPMQALEGPLLKLDRLYFFTDTDAMRDERRKKYGLSTNNALDAKDGEGTSSSDDEEQTNPQQLG